MGEFETSTWSKTESCSGLQDLKSRRTEGSEGGRGNSEVMEAEYLRQTGGNGNEEEILKGLEEWDVEE